MRIIFKHILPNSLAPLIIIITLGIAGTIFLFAALAFYGFGDPNAVSWGDDLNKWQNSLIEYPWMPMFPAMMIFFTVLGFNILGDALRDVLTNLLFMNFLTQQKTKKKSSKFPENLQNLYPCTYKECFFVIFTLRSNFFSLK